MIRVITDNIAMWVTRHSTVDLDLSKTQTLLGTLKILQQLRGEFCVSSEVEHSFPQVGCVRNKLHYRTAEQNLKLSLWTLVCAWMVFPLSLSEIWFLKYCILPKTNQNWQ